MSTDGPRPHRLAGLTSTGARQHALNQGGEARGPAGALTQGNQGQCCDWDIGKKKFVLLATNLSYNAWNWEMSCIRKPPVSKQSTLLKYVEQ